jgi:hypothetical protein
VDRASPSDRPADDAVGEGQAPRRFGRLRPRHEDEPPANSDDGLPSGEDAGIGQDVTPFDSAKTFVGPNGTYYDERWRWMEWRGKEHSWNWAAALSFGVWLAYRRLYFSAALFYVWLMAVLAMALSGINLRLLAIAHVIVAVLVGRYGNTLYRQRFRSRALDVARDQDGHSERVEALSRSGGIDRFAACSMVLAIIAGAVAVVWRIRSTVGVQIDW